MDTPQKIRELLEKHADNTVYNISSTYDDNVQGQAKFTYAGFTVVEHKLYVKKLIPWLGCRGYMCEALFGTSNGGPFRLNGNYYTVSSIHKQAASMFIKDVGEPNFSQSMRLLNYLERLAGWEQSFYKHIVYTRPLSSWETGPARERQAYLWVGDRKWFSSTIYVSLLCLLIRVANKYMFEPNDTFVSWASRIASLEYASLTHYDIRNDDAYTLQRLLAEHSNTVHILLAEQEFLTEELDYVKMRRGSLSQGAAQDAGVYNATSQANQISVGYKETRKYEELWMSRLEDSYASKVNRPMILRYGVALNAFGDRRKLTEPLRKQNVF